MNDDFKLGIKAYKAAIEALGYKVIVIKGKTAASLKGTNEHAANTSKQTLMCIDMLFSLATQSLISTKPNKSRMTAVKEIYIFTCEILKVTTEQLLEKLADGEDVATALDPETMQKITGER